MKGAIPPEAMEDKMAGMRRMKKWRRGTRENKRRMEGVSGLVALGCGGWMIALVFVSSESIEERGETLSS